METPFRRDVVQELCQAALQTRHQCDIKIDLYFSHPDWYDADFRLYCFHPLQVPSSNVVMTDYRDAKNRLGDREVIVPDAESHPKSVIEFEVSFVQQFACEVAGVNPRFI